MTESTIMCCSVRDIAQLMGSDKWVWSNDGMVIIEGNWRIRRKTPSPISLRPPRITLEVTDLRGQNPASRSLSNGTAITCVLKEMHLSYARVTLYLVWRKCHLSDERYGILVLGLVLASSALVFHLATVLCAVKPLLTDLWATGRTMGRVSR
jgi:hypothetical protein